MYCSWGAATKSDDVFKFNPSILQSGMIGYMSGKGTTFQSDSGRTVHVQPETLASRRMIGTDVHLDPNYYAADYTDTDTNHSKQITSTYFNNHNTLPTQEYTTPGQKMIRLDSGRVVEFDVPQSETNIATLPRPNISTTMQRISSTPITPTSTESFEAFGQVDMSDELYKQILRTSAKSICDWLLSFRPYRPWMKHWNILRDNLEKTQLNITKLSTNDSEIAYTVNKGEIIKFRWQDKKRYVPKDVFMYVLLHELTHESFPPSFQGHQEPFPSMLCLLCVAGTELDILHIENIPSDIYTSNNRPITSRESIKAEVLYGIDMLIEANRDDKSVVEYYECRRKFINKYI